MTNRPYRTDLPLINLGRMFPDDATAEAWFVKARWPDGVRCAHCESSDIRSEGKHPAMPYRCQDCRKFFSVKTGNVLQSSKIGYQKWAMAFYIMTTGPRASRYIQHEAPPRHRRDPRRSGTAAGECMKNLAGTNGITTFWSLMKRGRTGRITTCR